MTITKEKKVSIAKKLTDAFRGVQSIVFVHFKGLSVLETNAMRKELRARAVGYTVAKKTLVKRALGELSLQGEMPPLEGEIALAYGEDPVVPASSILEFAKKHKEQLAIVGGVFEGRYQSQNEMLTIASIPPMQTLRGMFVNVLNSPIAGVVVALNAIAGKKTS
jgi:large subunit ribosomal protein L10